MKLITTTALTLVAAAAAGAPLSAQGYGNSSQPQSYQPQSMQPSSQSSAAPKSAPAGKQAMVKPSKNALKAIIDLQSAVKANDTANIPAKMAAAKAVATTKEDRYLIAQFQLQVAVKANDLATVSAAVDEMAATGVADQVSLAQIYSGVGGSLYNAKQYDRAAAAYARAVALNPADLQSQKLLGESRFAAGQKTEAIAAFQRAMQMQAAAGQKPDEALIKRAVAVAYDQQSPVAFDLARQWVAAYPSAASWSDALAIYSNVNRPDTESMLALYRLRQATGAMTRGGEWAQYARVSAEFGNFNEAQAALDAGIAAKAINPSDMAYSDLVKGLKTKPKATAADLAEATKTAQSGMALLRIGDRYYAMGDYAKAVELYRMAMSKPGVDAATANLHIGMALARSGDKAGATTALNAVTGPRAEIAKFWLTYVIQKG
jgi:tetratricopeptide (TPR) repeat protein